MLCQQVCIDTSQPRNDWPVGSPIGSRRSASALDQASHVGFERLSVIAGKDGVQSLQAIGVDLSLEGFDGCKLRHFTSCSWLFCPSIEGSVELGELR
jgi:hypothetical protein